MSDIFEIKGVDAELVVNGQHYKFADPRFEEKILIQKELKALKKNSANMDEEDLLLASHQVNKKMIKQYLPQMTDADLDKIGDNALMALLDQIGKLTDIKFGAVVQKVEQLEKK